MKRPRPNNNSGRVALGMFALAILLGLKTAHAVAPLASVAVVASAISFVITTSAGAVSIVTNLGNYTGDYEEQVTKVVAVSYRETIFSDYRGLKNLTLLYYWVDPNGESQYLTRRWHQLPGEEWVLDTQDADPFDFVAKWQNYNCSMSPYVQNSRLIRTHIQIGYEVPKPARLAKNCAPDPLPMVLFWDCLPLQNDCYWKTVVNPQFTMQSLVPRRRYASLTAPCENIEVRSISVKPRP